MTRALRSRIWLAVLIVHAGACLVAFMPLKRDLPRANPAPATVTPATTSEAAVTPATQTVR